LTDPRFATNTVRREHADILTDAAQTLFASNTTEYWQTVLTEAGVQNEKVQTYREYAEHPQTNAVEAIAMLDQGGTGIEWPVPNIPGLPRLQRQSAQAAAPTLGQHTREILAEAGYDNQTVERLIEMGTVV